MVIAIVYPHLYSDKTPEMEQFSTRYSDQQ